MVTEMMGEKAVNICWLINDFEESNQSKPSLFMGSE
jgi:hypothetical protein